MRGIDRESVRSGRWMGVFLLLPVLALLCAGTVGCPKQPPEAAPAAANPPAEPATPSERATALYDSGRYDDARAILETLDAQGALDGPGLYRLGYTYGAAGDAAKQSEIMARALTALQEESQTHNRLEVAFFLANAQTNLAKTADARATATAATAEVEAGRWPKPTSAIDMFRLAKLYADQGRKDAATEWYGRALDRFQADGATAPGYLRWARRWLGQEAYARSDYAEAERHYAGLAQAAGASAAEYDRLAASAVRQAHWTVATDAWREAEKLDPANADRPRYCRNLVRLAQDAGPLPAADPSQKAWSTLSKEDLERTMTDQANRVREARSGAAPSDPAAREKIVASLAQARSIFVAAALEYALRDYDIRETAFLGGYAPLIFHPEDWTLPEEEPGR